MKTTIHIPDALLEEAKKVAVCEHTTVTALVEQSLRKIVVERKRKGVFRFRKATFKGKGLQPEVAGASWERIRALAYEGRGG
jgi:CRISPR/Cas system-associated protein Csm6